MAMSSNICAIALVLFFISSMVDLTLCEHVHRKYFAKNFNFFSRFLFRPLCFGNNDFKIEKLNYIVITSF